MPEGYHLRGLDRGTPQRDHPMRIRSRGANSQLQTPVSNSTTSRNTPRETVQRPASPVKSSPANHESLVQQLVAALSPIITSHQQSTSSKLKELETSINALSGQISDVKSETQDQTKQVAGFLDRTHLLLVTASRQLAARIENVEKSIGTSRDQDDKKTLFQSLDAVSFAVGELVEKANDPDACVAEPSAEGRSQTYTPERSYANVAIECSIPSPPLVPRSVSVGVMTLQDEMPTVREEPAPTYGEIGVSTSAPVFVDVSVGRRTPTPSPIQMSVGVMTSPRQTDDQPMKDLPAISPERSSCAFRSPEAQPIDLTLEHVSSYHGSPSSIASGASRASQSSPHKTQAYFTSVPPVPSNSLLRARWASPEDEEIDELDEDYEETEQFRPDTSPETLERYSVLRRTSSSEVQNSIPKPTHPMIPTVTVPCSSPSPAPESPLTSPASTRPPSRTTSPIISFNESKAGTHITDDIEGSFLDLPLPATLSPIPSQTSLDEISVSLLVTEAITPDRPRTPPRQQESPPVNDDPGPCAPSPISISSDSDIVALDSKPSTSSTRPPPSNLKPPANPSPSQSIIYISSRSPSPMTELSSDEDSDDAPVVPVKSAKRKAKSEKSTPPPKQEKQRKALNLKTVGKSAAVTRIKKRKLKPEELNKEPPLKRAKLNAASSQPKSPLMSSRKKRSPVKSVPGTNWPPKARGKNPFYKEFIQCDDCSSWYHYGCVGIAPGDPRIGTDTPFTCPPCAHGKANVLVSAKGLTCCRPDCAREGSQPNEFFVAGIVGRMTGGQSMRGPKYLWLMKWDGYPIERATWEEESSMSDPGKLIQEFQEAAFKEGFTDDDFHSTVLLREAVEGGWKDPKA